MYKQFIQITVLGLALLGVAACKTENGGDGAAMEPDNVVARVNGQAIGAATLESQQQAMSQRGQTASRSQALQELITVKLLAQEAEEKGLHETPEVAMELERRRSSLLAQHLIRAELDTFEPSQEDIQSLYDQQFGAEGSAREYRARHILVDGREPATAIIEQLDQGGDFATIAKEQSTGPSGKTGGDLGWFQPADMVPAFGDAVKALEPGEHSAEPVQTQFGWHVVLLEETREAQPPKLEEVKSQLRSQLVSQHLQQYVADMRESGEVEIIDESLDTGQQDDAGAAAEDTDGGSGEE